MKCRRAEILAAAVVLFLCTSPVLATIHFKDGGIHDIDYQINESVWVDYGSPGLETTLNIRDRAIIPFGVTAWEDSIINMFGGSVGQLSAHHSSQVAVSGGSINLALFAYDSSRITVSGGSVRKLFAGHSSQVAVSGGSIGGLGAYDSSQVTVSGGTITDNLYADNSSQVTVSGGLFGGEILVLDNAVLTIHGWDFAVDGTPVGYTEIYSIFGGYYTDEPYRQLTGNLLSGDPINNQFRIGNSGKIVLIPEPATLLLLGLGGLALLRRRRHEVF